MQNDTIDRPVKVNDFRGSKTWRFRGRTITSEACRESRGPRKPLTWTSVRVDGVLFSGSMKQAVAKIVAGKL